MFYELSVDNSYALLCKMLDVHSFWYDTHDSTQRESLIWHTSWPKATTAPEGTLHLGAECILSRHFLTLVYQKSQLSNAGTCCQVQLGIGANNNLKAIGECIPEKQTFSCVPNNCHKKYTRFQHRSEWLRHLSGQMKNWIELNKILSTIIFM